MSYIFSFLTKSYFIRAGVLLSMLCYRLIESIVLALDVSIGAEYSKGRPPMNFHLHLLYEFYENSVILDWMQLKLVLELHPDIH